MSGEAKKASRKRRLWKYSAYAIGCPLLVTGVTLGVELTPSTLTNGGSLVRPDFGQTSCFFSTQLANFLYFHLLMLIVQLANLLFFLLTVRALYTSWKQSTNLRLNRQSSPKQEKNINRFWVILKLYVVMGGTWLFEVTGFLLSWRYGKNAVWRYQVCSPMKFSNLSPLSYHFLKYKNYFG